MLLFVRLEEIWFWTPHPPPSSTFLETRKKIDWRMCRTDVPGVVTRPVAAQSHIVYRSWSSNQVKRHRVPSRASCSTSLSLSQPRNDSHKLFNNKYISNTETKWPHPRLFVLDSLADTHEMFLYNFTCYFNVFLRIISLKKKEGIAPNCVQKWHNVTPNQINKRRISRAMASQKKLKITSVVIPVK